jgi:hypothetical protein
VSGEFLSSFLTAVEIPPAIAQQVVATHAAKYADRLAFNQSLGDAAAPLAKYKMDVDAMASLVRMKNPVVLDAVLASREAREKVVSGIKQYWRLSPADQLRLADRPVSEYMARSIVTDASFSPQAKALVVARAPASVHVNWLYTSSLSDDEMFVHLERVAKKKDLLPSVIVPVLIARPALRERALHSKIETLKIAACWTELGPRLHNEAAAFALSGNLKTTASPVIGLLAQPSFNYELRGQLARALTQAGKVAAVRAGVRLASSRLHVARPLSLLNDRSDINAVLDAASNPPALMHAQLVTASMLFELSRNPNLDRDHLERLMYAVCLHDAITASDRFSPLRHVLHPLAARLDPQVAPTDTLIRLGASDESVKSLAVVPVTWTGADLKTAVSQEPYRNTAVDTRRGGPEESLKRTIANLAGSTALLRGLSGLFSDQLGDATSEVSAHAWMLFLALVAEDPDVPLGTVLASAKNLAAAEQVPTDQNQ